ncbi:arginine--tRNA ligase [Thiobacillus sp.]|uniref:arginine--tRNA ligase n=1 Tax=Thiobacillus sp. TaxID=924 RepID=UPI00183B27AF|nr:arginine--tRNA ligase [Thiobacillus sp.]MBC2729948.1 arginine--tRNA ligase [Thiobacillus sp.]MBC2738685.1 arginine--tRNA ligase [Thiobacillus sp.]MBC2761022.1 arginine--tRNA ligase [Thiobacillus sp.]MBD3813472.1 arginine--tRNA ligase [Betaproteobacteria bacterium]
MSNTHPLKDQIALLIGEALETVAPDTPVSLEIERPKNPAHGDFSSNAAMQLARPLKKNPRELAQLILTELPKSPLIAKAEIAGAGFINFHLTPAAWHGIVPQIRAAATQFGHADAGAGHKVLVEFVSANPTGPLHVGHGRQAALGDAICNLYAAQGWEVTREFYYNDAGVQIATLANSVQARARGLKPGDAAWPEAAYNGDYIADIAADFLARKSVKSDDREFTASGDVDDLDSIRQFAVAYLRHEQDLDLQAFAVRFDNYYLESSLYTSGRVEATVQKLVDAGKTYEQDGALWLRTTDYGDDKDRVMKKSDGTYTYFVPDVAYHIAKWERGYDRAINIQGTDHHGTIARVRAGLQAAGVGIAEGYPDYLLHTMVRVMRGGEEVKISKRAGSYVTLRDLIEWTSKDAVRFFLLSRKADTEYIFDVDLALARNNDNPVYYVQYAHARICRVFEEWDGMSDALDGADLAPLTAQHELALLQRLAEYPETVATAARELAPHLLVHYLQVLAGDFHSWYNAEKFLVDDTSTKLARLTLADATRIAIVNGLALLGVSAPEKM